MCGSNDSDLEGKLKKNASCAVPDSECVKLASLYAQYQTRALCDIEEITGK